MRLIPLCIFVSLLLLACSTNPKDDAVLNEAFQVHQSSLEIEKKVMESMSQIRDYNVNYSNFIKNESNSDGVKILVKAFQSGSVKAAMSHKKWKEELPEIPGFEHTHADGTVHKHEAKMRITSKEMLEVQKEFRDSIQHLHDRCERLIADFNKIKPAE